MVHRKLRSADDNNKSFDAAGHVHANVTAASCRRGPRAMAYQYQPYGALGQSAKSKPMQQMSLRSWQQQRKHKAGLACAGRLDQSQLWTGPPGLGNKSALTTPQTDIAEVNRATNCRWAPRWWLRTWCARSGRKEWRDCEAMRPAAHTMHPSITDFEDACKHSCRMPAVKRALAICPAAAHGSYVRMSSTESMHRHMYTDMH